MKLIPAHLHELFASYIAEETVSSIRHSVVNDLTALSALCYRLKIEHVMPMADTDGARSAQDLLENIQAYVKQASRRLEVTFVSSDAPATGTIDVAALLRELAGHMPAPRGVRVEVPRAEPLALAVDGAELELAVACLIANAYESIEAAPDGADAGSGQVSLRCAEGPHDTVRIDVEDDGRSLGSKARGRVFEPFFTTKPGRLGLGLNVVRRIAGRWGGTVDFQANASRGVLASISLPRVT